MKTTLIICAVLFASFSFTSCGGKKEEGAKAEGNGDSTKTEATAEGAGEETTEPAATTEDSTAEAATTDAAATETKTEAKKLLKAALGRLFF
jgi:hypothetical protein